MKDDKAQNGCLVCGYFWIGKPDAKSCPNCHSYKWNCARNAFKEVLR